MIIYIVTTGSYSDYHIQAVFDSRELAEKLVDELVKKELAYYPEGKLTAKEVIDGEYIYIEQWELNKEYDGEIEETQ